MATTLFPLQYLRQNAQPIDVDSVFNTTAERLAYLSNGRRYPGQVVADLQENKVYVLDSAGSAWIEIGSGGSGGSGYSGVSGYSGTTGSSGYSGGVGPQGVSGYSGLPGAGTPGGLDTQVQFNDGGVFAGSSGFTYDGGTCTVGLSKISSLTSLNVKVGTPPQGWISLYGTITDQTSDYSTSIAYDSLGNIYNAGFSSPFLVKYDPSGNIIWQLTFSEDRVDAVKVDSNNDVYIIVSNNFGGYFILVKLDSTGTVLWQISFDPLPGTGMNGVDLTIDSSNNVYVLAQINQYGFADDPTFIAKVDSSGVLQWQKTLSSSPASSVKPGGITIDSLDNIYVNTRIGNSFSSGSECPVLVKYDSSGNLLWQKQYITGANESSGLVIIDSSNNIYITHKPNLLMKCDSSGNILWQKYIAADSPSATIDGLELDSSGNVYVVLSIIDLVSGNQQISIYKFDTTGLQIFQRVLGSANNLYTGIYFLDKATRNLTIIDNDYVLSGFFDRTTGGLSLSDALVAKFPTNGDGIGTWGNFTYSAGINTVVNASSVASTSTLVSTLGTISTSPGGLTAGAGTRLNNLTMIAGIYEWNFNSNGTTDFPNYTFPLSDGSPGAALTTNGTGALSWNIPLKLDSGCSLIVNSQTGALPGTQCGSIALGLSALECGNSLYNIAIGCGAGRISCGSCCNIYMGNNAGYCSTASGNILVGNCAGYRVSDDQNVIIGNDSYDCAPGGFGNVVVGSGALRCPTCNTTSNVAIGYGAMWLAQPDYGNIAIGVDSLRLVCGFGNTAVGLDSGRNITQGNYNNAFGYGALNGLTSGKCNIGIGYGAGYSLSTGSNNTVIGSLGGTADMECTVLIGAGCVERIKVDDTGLYINCLPFTGGGTPGGLDTQVQFNDGGVFAGSSGFTYDGGTNTVGLTNISNTTDINITVGTPLTSWISLYGDLGVNTRDDYSSAVSYDSSGNIYSIGADGNNGTPFLVKYNSSGDIVWQIQFDEVNNYYKTGDAVEVDSSGNVYAIVGTNDVVTNFTLFKLNSSGAILWQLTFDDITAEGGVDISVDTSGNVYVTGSVNNPSTTFIIKINSSGVVQWQNILTGISYNYPQGLAIDSVGNVYINTQDNDGLGLTTPYLVKYDNSGNLLWQKQFGNGDTHYSGLVAVDASGNVYTTNNKSTGLSDYYNLIKWDSSGNIIWQKNITGTNGYPIGLALDPSGYVYLAATVYTNPRVIFIHKFDSAGVEIWQRQLSGTDDIYTYYYWATQNLAVNSTSFVVSGYTYTALLPNSEAIVAQFPTDGGGLGTWGNFIYSIASNVVVPGSLVEIPGTLVNTPGTFPTAAGVFTTSVAPGTNNITPVIGGISSWSLKNDGSTQLPGYTLPAADGTCGQSLTTDGAGNVGWASSSVSSATPTTLGTVYAYTTSSSNISLGWCSGNTTQTAASNISIGNCSLIQNTYGADNIAVGSKALFASITGGQNIAIGSCSLAAATYGAGNVAIGYNSLSCRTGPGFNNIAIGLSSMQCSISGNANIGIGLGSLYQSSGSNNISLGDYVMSGNSGSLNIGIGRFNLQLNYGCNNIALGDLAMRYHASGCNNIAFGCSSSYFSNTGSDNITLGTYSAYCNCRGSHNIALGKCTIAFGSNGCCNTAIGQGALCLMNTGRENIAIGTFSQSQMCSGCNNISLGACSLYFGGNNDGNIAIGSLAMYCGSSLGYNIAIGDNALKCGTGCFYNIALGASALFGPTNGTSNIALGYASMFCGSSGGYNVAIGRGSMSVDSITGNCNTAVGSFALQRPGGGSCNIAVGSFALACNFTGSLNTAVGQSALQYNRAGWHNIALGNCALFCNIYGCNNFAAGTFAMGFGINCGCDNIAIGREALAANTGGCYNIGLGCLALGCNTLGKGNIAQGYQAMRANTSGCYNIAVGMYSLNANTHGHFNIAQGHQAMRTNTTGCQNIAIGLNAMEYSCIGSFNTAVGPFSLRFNTSGNFNIAVGSDSLYNNGCGCNNIATGIRALMLNQTGSHNIAIGSYGLCCNLGGSCSIAIGSYGLANFNSTGTNIAIGFNSGCSITTGINNTIIGSLPAAAGCVCTVLIGAGTCERIKVDNNGLCVNGATLQGNGLVVDAVGFRTLPQNSQSANYTTVAADSGKHLLHPSSDANPRTYTIDSNLNVPYPVGTAITFVNKTSQVLTIAINSDTLTLAGTTTTGSRTLGQNGVATAVKIDTTEWIISGTGLT